ncbi:immunoglobulin-like domain-containing protein [Pseudomonas fluorescens]|uniref:immunoglobulin-like domain-containing protein n=1 Tax=Pseudomonas fluorescens TaxID=294 RepID=UPI003F9CA561
MYTAPVQGEDVYKDGGPLSITIITEATVKDQVFEDLQLSKEPGVVQINDTTDTVTVNIGGRRRIRKRQPNLHCQHQPGVEG